MALSEDFQARVDALGKNQRGVLDSLANRPYPGGGWVWSNHSETVRICESLVRRGLVVAVTVGEGRREHKVYSAVPQIREAHLEKEAARSRRVLDQHREENAARERATAERIAQERAVTRLIGAHREQYEALLAEERAEHGVARSV